MQAQVDEKVDIRLYHIRTADGSMYRKKRRQLRRMQETAKTKAEELPDKVCPEEPTHAPTYPQSTPPLMVPTTVEQHPASGTSTTPVTQILPPHVINSMIQFVKDATYFRLFFKPRNTAGQG